MSTFIDPTGQPTYGIALCARCSRKFPLAELYPDPNSPGLMVCKEDLDELDPYRLPARVTEDITLPFVRPDVPLTAPTGFSTNPHLPAPVATGSYDGVCITINWSLPLDAIGFRVFRSVDGGTYDLLVEVSQFISSYRDCSVTRSAHAYNYYVIALYTLGDQSSPSNVVNFPQLLHMLMAVATDSVMTSFDALVWTKQAGALSGIWNSICYSDTLNRWLAVNNSGGAMYSDDLGVTWTASSVNADRALTSVAWSTVAGLFVAVAASGDAKRVWTSPTGAVWTGQTLTGGRETKSWRRIIYVPFSGKLVAGADSDPNPTMYSSNGTTWLEGTCTNSSSCSSIMHNGARVAMGGNGLRTLFSDNGGVDWSDNVSLPSAPTCGAASPSIFALGQAGVSGNAWSSPTATAWTLRVIQAKFWTSMTYSASLGLFVAVNNNPVLDAVSTSPNAIAWAASVTPANCNLAWNCIFAN